MIKPSFLVVLAMTLSLLAPTHAIAAEPSLRRQALDLIDIQDYEGALVLYRQLVSERPADPRAHYDLAGTLGFLRRYREAVEPIEQAIRLRPDFLEAYQAAAVIHASAGDPAAAFRDNLRAADLGSVTAMFELVWIFKDGLGVDPDPQASVDWATRAARAGHVGAMDFLVDVHLNGWMGQRVDQDLAGHWAMQAWQATHPAGQ